MPEHQNVVQEDVNRECEDRCKHDGSRMPETFCRKSQGKKGENPGRTQGDSADVSHR